MNGRLEQPPANATDDIATIREALFEARTIPAGQQVHAPEDALARVEARLAAPCHCDKCLDCLAANGYEAAIEHAEQAERERDEARAEADRLRKAVKEAKWLIGAGSPRTVEWCDRADAWYQTASALAGPQTKEQT